MPTEDIQLQKEDAKEKDKIQPATEGVNEEQNNDISDDEIKKEEEPERDPNFSYDLVTGEKLSRLLPPGIECKNGKLYSAPEDKCDEWMISCCGQNEIDYDIPIPMSEREKELRKHLPEFTLEPMRLTCPRCEKEITTRVEEAGGLLSTLVSFGICLTLVGSLGCCLIPCCIPKLMNRDHYCPDCNVLIGDYKRIKHNC